jgi:sigma-B regulation protein RsbU (phosphoserine phosphatase)
VETVEAEGFPLGLFPGVEYQQLSLVLDPGDTMIFFSDGIVDAQNHAGEMFGNERLLAVVSSVLGRPALETADAILAEVGRFQAGLERFDDETVVILRAL